MAGPNGIEGSQRPDQSSATAPVQTDPVATVVERLIREEIGQAGYLLDGYRHALVNLDGNHAVNGVPDRIRMTNPRHADYLLGLHGAVRVYEDFFKHFDLGERAEEVRRKALRIQPTEEDLTR